MKKILLSVLIIFGFSVPSFSEDFIEDSYILEVSSPGLGRTLKKDKHLSKSIGIQ